MTNEEIDLIQNFLDYFMDQRDGKVSDHGKIIVRLVEVRDLLRHLRAGQHQILANQETLLMTDAEFKVTLTKIDEATTKTSTNVAAIGTIADDISSDIDRLLATSGLSPETIALAEAIKTRAEAASGAAEALVPVLQAIANKGPANPVPVPVPPPVDPVVT